MTFSIRRVVTGHDAAGKATVTIDEPVKNARATRPGATATVIWSTKGFPVDNADDTDGSLLPVGTSEPNGTVFRVIEFAPGVAPRNHRTDSIDYAVVMSGEIDMTLDDTVVRLRAGDVLVQRGTIHDWVVAGPAPCVIAFVLIDAKPVEIGGRSLNAIG
jgi:quercetin dioxygenase-like cupin family protein